ncbi:MAG: phosphate acetyltransferase [Chloroflexota bacterium]|nr:phosphate acetyltransferase [Chloroflexota bacterium]
MAEQQRKNLLVLSTTATGGKTTVALGLIKLLSEEGRRVAYFKPVAQRQIYPSDRLRDRDKAISATVFNELSSMSPTESLTMEEAYDYFATGRNKYFAERIIELYQTIPPEADVVVVEGMQYDDTASTLAFEVNVQLAHSLTADVILVVDAYKKGTEAIADMESIVSSYREEGVNIEGVILNKVRTDEEGNPAVPDIVMEKLKEHDLQLFGVVPFVRKIAAPRVRDLVEPLKAKVLRGEEQLARRALRPIILAMHAENAVNHLEEGDLAIVPGDREDIIMMTHLYESALDKASLAGVVLTVGYEPHESIMELIANQSGDGLPILLVETDTFETSTIIQNKRVYIEEDDWEKIRWTVELIVEHLHREEILDYLDIPARDVISPAAFRYSIMQRAKAADKTIVLPEGNEPRTLQAASIILERGITEIVLLGDKADILEEARRVNANVLKAEIINPVESELFDSFVDELVELRKHKGMNRTTAEDLMHDNVYFGTMMLHRGMVDGLVSGAVHTTANTIRPAFQIIKTQPGVDIVSSVFFMLLADRVWVFGDCAVVPDPTAPQLAQIAVQSYHTSKAFGINPKVAMISYSTLASGEGKDVEKVREATELAKEMEPEMLIDGPLQFDAAAIPDVAAKKAPDSRVAGHANVFIFPDLNTGNTTYKAVQRSGNYVSIGPVLQGLKRPVNDLSRGALVDDIVYTIAVTAVQATQVETADKVREREGVRV